MNECSRAGESEPESAVSLWCSSLCLQLCRCAFVSSPLSLPDTLSHTHKLTWSTRSARTPVGACVAHVAKARGQADAGSKCIGERGAR